MWGASVKKGMNLNPASPVSSRRDFLLSMPMVTAGFLALRGHVYAGTPQVRQDLYGPLVTDPNGIIDLPEGFSYRIVAKCGEEMADGLRRAGKPDGMAAFGTRTPGQVALVCNHEVGLSSPKLGAFGDENERLADIDSALIHDFDAKHIFHGGTSTMIYDLKERKLVKQWQSLAGTDRNCAGGPTPWGTWVTCEEPADLERSTRAREQHGWAFEVPVTDEPSLTKPEPLKALGRFRHEAIAVDPESGVVYETEDRGDGLIYRFLPKERGNLAAGGRLQALAIQGDPSCDTRNWENLKAPRFPTGKRFAVEWIDIDDSSSPKDDLRFVYHKKGAACFARGEGMWFGESEIYFSCTNGGSTQAGQIFRYKPSPFEGTDQESTRPGELELFLESDSTELLENCDNVTMAPWGDLIICEDGIGEQFVRGVARDGTVYNIGKNHSGSEFAGACFAPNAPHLFVNIQNEGLTIEITGPWENRQFS